jgi:hypothetical protein
MTPRLAVPVLLLALLAGCLAPAQTADDAPPAGPDASPVPAALSEAAPPASAPVAAPVPILRSGNLTAIGASPLLWTGAELDAEGEATESRNLTLEVPEGFWESHEGAHVLAIRWPLYQERWYTLEVRDASGKVLSQGVEGHAALGVGPVPILPVAGSAAVATLDRAASGAYVVVVEATQGAGAYEAAAHLQARARDRPAPGDLLPNLVTLPPMDLRVGETLGAPDLPGPVRGCDPDQTAARQVVKCLRFSNGIGNVGEGALEMRLEKDQGAKALAGQGGRFAQRVYLDDGTFRDVPSGNAEFHPAHGHFHYSGAATFRVHAYDLATETRGEVLKEGRKTGFCFGDLSLVLPGLTRTAAPRFDASGCLDPLTHDVWVTGLSPNWYDRYHYSWFDQFVDVGGLADGVYELVSTANHDGSILETTAADNEASAVFRLTGDAVEVLSTKASVPTAP